MWVSRLHPRQMMITDDTIQFVQLPLALISLSQPICVDKCEMKGNVQVKLSKNLHNTVHLVAKGGIWIKKEEKIAKHVIKCDSVLWNFASLFSSTKRYVSLYVGISRSSPMRIANNSIFISINNQHARTLFVLSIAKINTTNYSIACMV